VFHADHEITVGYAPITIETHARRGLAAISSRRLATVFCHSYFFALSPSSTRRRMASECVSFRSDAHASTAAKTSGETRAESNGLMPVTGRPGFFLSTDIAFFIVIVYNKSKPRGS
jgi:hypothetical protein